MIFRKLGAISSSLPNRLSPRDLGLLGCLLAMLCLAFIVGACGPTAPTEAPPPTEPISAATEVPSPVPTETATPMPAPTEAVPTSVEPSAPLTTELKATVIAGLPPTPTPETPGGESVWGDVAMLPLDTGGEGPPLWAAFTVGMGFYDWEHGHLVAIYTYDDEGWQVLSQVTLTDCADYINPDSLVQVKVEPSRVWLEVQSYTGAHSGCYDLFSFDGETLRREVSHFNSSPGAGNLADLNGDGLQEVVLNWTENYVFCYACGVRLPMFEVRRWDGEQLVEVELTEAPESAPAELRELNNHSVVLAQAGLWQDAAVAIAQAEALDIQDPALADVVAWNAILIQGHAEGLREEVESNIYPLLANVFYGDYAAAVEVMRPYSLEEIWEPESPLIQGTPAEGWDMALSDWISWTTSLALEVEPDLAAAHFLRGWAIHLVEPDDPEVSFRVEHASKLDPDEALFADSLAYLNPAAPTEGPGLEGIYEPLDPDICHELGQAMMQTLNVTVTIQEASFEDYVGGDTGTGCQLFAEGTGVDFESYVDVAAELGTMLAARGWEDDFMYAADGPTGTARGFRRGDKLCLLNAGWKPSEDANCPSDRPIPDCDLEPVQQLYTIILNCASPAIASLPEPSPTPTSAPRPTPLPTATPAPVAEEVWKVRTLLAGPGEPGRLYALLTDQSSGAWLGERVRFVISDDYGQTWSPFPGGLPAEECVVNVNLDYASAADALYASTCQGLYRWSGSEWAFVSPRQTGMVAIVYGQPNVIWATESFAIGGGVIRSDDGGVTWAPKGDGLVSFNGVANVAVDPRDANTLYAVIWPKYAGTYLRRGTSEGLWDYMPTPRNNSQIDTGISIDGATGALYVTAFSPDMTWQLWHTLNPNAPDMNDIRWEMVHDFGPDVSWATLLASGWSPEGLALYANLSSWLDKSVGSVGPPVLHRSLDGGQTWKPLPIP